MQAHSIHITVVINHFCCESVCFLVSTFVQTETLFALFLVDMGKGIGHSASRVSSGRHHFFTEIEIYNVSFGV